MADAALPEDLAALVGSRICHDLVNPLGAIGNGAELLVMEDSRLGPLARLIGDSVESATARLRLYRLAFGPPGAERIGQQFYRLDRQAVSITPAPDYIRADVVSEVFKKHQLERTSLLSRMATARVGEAFKTHPWIERVVRVEKRADGGEVKVLYRKPVAMVRVKSRHPEISGDALFAVYGEGILLPIGDFSLEDSQRYIQIIVPDSYPSGVGAPYGDERVMAAAQIAALLADDRESLQLAAIELTNPRRTFDENWIYAVIRSDATRFIWGSPPGEEVDGEPSATQKLEMIRSRPTIAGDLRLAKYRN